ncbi:MAG: FAD-binding protein [Candidatus Hydrogenedentes bacterium]|nr:FAD-binding protein [Candidatus Hydrogenedentota bacterium]
MQKTLQRTLRQATACELRFDDHSRQLYATDGSIYQIVPQGVALPRTIDEAATLLAALAQDGVPITPRGAGTGLAGGAIGEGVVVDFARYNQTISGLNIEARTVRAGAGVVLDELNAYLAPHGLAFGPDVATSSRATIGGMIGNNSSGARTPLYGTTIDHVRSVDVVYADGRVETIGLKGGGPQFPELDALIESHRGAIESRFHTGVIKRWPGYGIDRYLRAGGNFAKVFGGSEGTLAGIFSAELDLVPLPGEKGIGLIFFDTVNEAMQATVELLSLQPAAIEHIDDVLFDQTRGQLAFKAARDYLELDEKPCTSILLVEFYEHVEEKLAALEKLKLGKRKRLCRDATDQAHILNLRKSGLSLLTGCKGDAKPTAGIEDVAVPPDKLPEYVSGLQSLMAPLGLRGSFYGHAASGLLHVRPVVDLHGAGDIQKFRSLCDGVSALTRQFKGSLAAEHGVGIARTEYMHDHIGPEILDLMGRIKAHFDPQGVMNPGKVFPDGRYAIDTNLRQGAGSKMTELPFEPVLQFAAKDGSFVGNLEQCNGCGGCRKSAPTMCPTFVATGEDIMATRGRANTIRAVLEGRLDADADPLLSPALEAALSNCLSCKACTVECPSNVNMALLKAELLYARIRKHGVPLSARLVSRVDMLGELASLAPGLANATLKWRWLRALLNRFAGFSMERPLPPYARERFDAWFHKRRGPSVLGERGTVYLWDDCFVRFNEPNIGQAAVRVLEAAGYTVNVLTGRACCGRPAFSTGRLDVAARFGEKNIAVAGDAEAPIIFLEPSCYAMFAEDYRELGLAGAERLARRSVLFETFIANLLKNDPGALPFAAVEARTAVHGHCHAKALTDKAQLASVARAVPGNSVTMLDTGCCGMAGAFGNMESKYALSLAVAKPLIEKVKALDEDTLLVASGTSCRHQIEHLAGRTPLHMAELLDQFLP